MCHTLKPDEFKDFINQARKKRDKKYFEKHPEGLPV